MATYTKARLLEMNSFRTPGINWIINIDSISDTELGKLYPTHEAYTNSGRIYIVFPATKVLTPTDITRYNIWPNLPGYKM